MKWRELFCVTLREVKFDLKLIGNYVQSTKKLSKAVLENFGSISDKN